jgi:SAM-dependent methyltransferase
LVFHPRGPTFFELAEQALTSVERGYDLLAQKFDDTPFRTPEAMLERTFGDLWGPRSVAAAVDLCCGTGAALAHLRPLARERVLGVDLSRGMLDRARERLAHAPGDARVDLVHGDALAPDDRWGPAGSFDLATCFGAFGHILERDEPALVRAVRHVLRPGGSFVFVTVEGPPSASEPAFWMAHGFNLAMRARNALIRPPFVMYYLTFMLPRARALLEAEGFALTVTRGRYPAPFDRYVRVVATRS